MIFGFPKCSDDSRKVFLTRRHGLSLIKGEALFINEVFNLFIPQGVISTDLNSRHANFFPLFSGIISRTSVDNYEFFVFDDNVTLIILSEDPFYFLKIESRDFRFHMTNELNQIKAGIYGTSKSINTQPRYKEVGEYGIEVYFSPKEIKFSSSGKNQYRVIDNNGTTYVDLWRLVGAALRNVIYMPSYEEEQLNDDLIDGSEDGQSNIVFTRHAQVSDPSLCNIVSINLNFSIIAGRYLNLTEDLLGSDSLLFANKEELTRDYIAFFSIPLGNSKGANNYLATRDGIAVIIRGYNLNPIVEPLFKEGLILY